MRRFFKFLNGQGDDDVDQARRKFERRAGDHCVTLIDGKLYPVRNWSLGGLLISGDERFFGVGQQCNVTMKFKMRDDIVDVPHKAKIIRKGAHHVAFEFLPLPDKISTMFHKVVDDYVTQRFIESQGV